MRKKIKTFMLHHFTECLFSSSASNDRNKAFILLLEKSLSKATGTYPLFHYGFLTFYLLVSPTGICLLISPIYIYLLVSPIYICLLVSSTCICLLVYSPVE